MLVLSKMDKKNNVGYKQDARFINKPYDGGLKIAEVQSIRKINSIIKKVNFREINIFIYWSVITGKNKGSTKKNNNNSSFSALVVLPAFSLSNLFNLDSKKFDGGTITIKKIIINPEELKVNLESGLIRRTFESIALVNKSLGRHPNYYLKKRLNGLSVNGYHQKIVVWMAFNRNNEVTGYIVLAINQGKPKVGLEMVIKRLNMFLMGKGGEQTPTIIDIAVNPRNQNNGIGLRLMKEVFLFIWQERLKSIVLFVKADNKSANKLYKKAGDDFGLIRVVSYKGRYRQGFRFVKAIRMEYFLPKHYNMKDGKRVFRYNNQMQKIIKKIDEVSKGMTKLKQKYAGNEENINFIRLRGVELNNLSLLVSELNRNILKNYKRVLVGERILIGRSLNKI